MAVKIRGGSVGSVQKLKKGLKNSGGGGGGRVTRLPDNEVPLNVRIMDEPPEWHEYWEHYNATDKFFPCEGKDEGCQGCEDEPDKAPMHRYAMNAINVDEQKVIVLVIPATIAKKLLRKYDRHKTLRDRDYELTRFGTFETGFEFEVEEAVPHRMNFDRFEPLDVWGTIEGNALGGSDDDEDEDEDEDEVPARSTSRRAPAKKAVSRSRDYEDDDEDEPVRPARRPLKKSAPARKTLKRRS